MAISTFRDAETQINLLKREVEQLRMQMKNSTVSSGLNSGNGSTTVVQNFKEVDSQLTPDGSNVYHKLYHIFELVKMKALEVAEKITVQTLDVIDRLTANFINVTDTLTAKFITVSNTLTTLNLGATTLTINNSGGPRNFIIDAITGGAISQFRLTGNPTRTLFLINYYNDGNTPVTFFDTNFYPYANNTYFLGNPSQRWANVVTSNFDVNVAISANGHLGFTGTDSVIQNIGVNTATIQYKDWVGNNQSMTVVTGLNVTPHPGLKFYLGIRSNT